jgi:predicted DNA binding CopG/RHH family protein
MTKRRTRVREEPAQYYEQHNILEEIDEEPVEFALDEELRKQILSGKRVRRLQNISIKLDPVQISALKKVATIKSIPYQTLIRQWLAEGLRKELLPMSK